MDLQGGDINGGMTATAYSIDDCCAACKAQASCGAFTFLPNNNLCYLKYSTGWTWKTNTGLQSVIVAASSTPSTPTPTPPPTGGGKPGGYTFVPMTQQQMQRMYQLTSIFENADVSERRARMHSALLPSLHTSSSPFFILFHGFLQINLQYAYADRLGDDRGVTYGFCGFTTGTSDGLQVGRGPAGGNAACCRSPVGGTCCMARYHGRLCHASRYPHTIKPVNRRWWRSTPSSSPATHWQSTCRPCERWKAKATSSPG